MKLPKLIVTYLALYPIALLLVSPTIPPKLWAQDDPVPPQAEPVRDDDDKDRYPNCPHELMFVHFDMYYYSVIKCPNTIQSQMFGYSHPVATGCGTLQCNCAPCSPEVVLDPERGTETIRTDRNVSKIPANQVSNADKVLSTPPHAATVQKIKVINASGLEEYFFAVTTFSYPYAVGPAMVHRFARQVDGVPTTGNWLTPSGTEVTGNTLMVRRIPFLIISN